VFTAAIPSAVPSKDCSCGDSHARSSRIEDSKIFQLYRAQINFSHMHEQKFHVARELITCTFEINNSILSWTVATRRSLYEAQDQKNIPPRIIAPTSASPVSPPREVFQESWLELGRHEVSLAEELAQSSKASQRHPAFGSSICC
jgi:hypothetical protein